MTKMIVVAGFLLAFAAGWTIGVQSRRGNPPPATRPSGPSGWLTAELNLDARQQEELRKIWSETARQGSRERDERRRRLVRERDEAIVGLVRPEDKPRYDEIMKRYTDQMAELDREWRSSFEQTVSRTKKILTPEQQVRYEEMLRRHEADRGSRDWRRGDRERDRGRRGGRRDSAPAASQAG